MLGLRLTTECVIEAGEEYCHPWLGIMNDTAWKQRDISGTLEDRLKQARTWFEHCKSTDGEACRNYKGEWPQRLLDVGSNPIRLVDSSLIGPARNHDPKEGYACLSYVLGESGNIKTTIQSLNAHQRGIDGKMLPHTIVDVVLVTRALSLRYLWVDALYIVQDDPKDWKSQIPRMASVYQSAEITISAQGAADVHAGFLSLGIGMNAPLRRFQVEFCLENGIIRTGKFSIRGEEKLYQDVEAHYRCDSLAEGSWTRSNLPLSTRAWAFQEHLLGRRILYATPSELAWRCGMRWHCEYQKRSHEDAGFTEPHDFWTNDISCSICGMKRNRLLNDGASAFE